MSSINPNSSVEKRETSFLSSIKPTARPLLGASALFLMNLPITIAEQGAFQSSYSNESNNYTIIGKNILLGVCLGVGVIGAVAYRCLTKGVPKEELIDKFRNSPEFLGLQIREIRKSIEAKEFQDAKRFLNNIADASLRSPYRGHISYIATINEALDENRPNDALDHLSTMAKRTEKQKPSKIKKKETVTLGTQTDLERDDDILKLEREIRGLKLEQKSLTEHFDEQQDSLVQAQGIAREARGALKLNAAMKPSGGMSILHLLPVSDDEKLRSVFKHLEKSEKDALIYALEELSSEKRIKIKKEWCKLSDYDLLKKLKSDAKAILEGGKTITFSSLIFFNIDLT
ncbi:MAG: hypothetical protein K940chlam5_00717 [Candidatus Anoxychlamydiales bacterium]|nr:hypothetical protein [Candidatus Anoxychlamydiales bacterium]